MAGQPDKAIIVDPKQLLAGLRDYFMTPQEMRGDIPNMTALAEYLGCEVRDLNSVMASNPEMGNDILQATALAGAVQIPRVLFKLMEAVEAGSVKAAEIYLDFIRKTIQDERLMNMAKKVTMDLTGVMANVGNQIDLLLSASQQPNAEAARQHLSSPVVRNQASANARAEIALETDRSIPKAAVMEIQT
jgi:hypothetical protein|tara:strand:+ start:127 stop:693 length:567 start_codon:yes stop_codon:yes gene_type:complete